MKIEFPSPAFDDAVAAVCHGVASDDHVRALNDLLRRNFSARDEYILRLEVHSRLASDSDLFGAETDESSPASQGARLRARRLPTTTPRHAPRRRDFWPIAMAVGVAVLAIAWGVWSRRAPPGFATTSQAVAMLSEAVGAQWASTGERPRLGAPLEPGWLRLEAGMAQVVFYSGARMAIEGPAEVQLISSGHAVCRRGKVTAEVPPQARGFRIDTPQGQVTDLGTAFGLEVNDRRTEVHVFKGEVTLQTPRTSTDDNLREGSGAVIESTNAPRRIAADQTAFAALFQLQAKSSAADARRLTQWRMASEQLNRDPSLLVHFAFDDAQSSRWQLPNVSAQNAVTGDATLVGCRWGEGRWPGKRALEFQSVSDRVRLNVPGECDALTIAAWVRVQGLDRQLNSLFMGDGMAPGSVHWLIRSDGVLGITIVGEGTGKHQIATSPPVFTLDRFGMWVHLAVVVDGRAGRVIHYVNGRPVGENALRIKPPYRVGTAELGNWNAKGFPENDPFMIRNFSGAMDEFCLFLRPLEAREVAALYAEGRPDAEVLVSRD